ncbi:hypothetical protein X271_00533 [Candidatus Hepatoplasma crinochetorum Av]|uniref:Schlafen group 3-like DNA/RNA helicase domain-containing protein n=1 Tax=Candidatus Hepatoplasma crinochetorum Av TaxID=1427984 RepID=W8GGA7_9MOLU|nr:DNA/RNA helicase domain-containing protein [Candidatus Hepatoplasma crinochetorum]AHK22633.1 hypothetical protein X271_00533 [Candidatus Hepatoplasma crinochetorum Av]
MNLKEIYSVERDNLSIFNQKMKMEEIYFSDNGINLEEIDSIKKFLEDINSFNDLEEKKEYFYKEVMLCFNDIYLNQEFDFFKYGEHEILDIEIKNFNKENKKEVKKKLKSQLINKNNHLKKISNKQNKKLIIYGILYNKNDNENSYYFLSDGNLKKIEKNKFLKEILNLESNSEDNKWLKYNYIYSKINLFDDFENFNNGNYLLNESQKCAICKIKNWIKENKKWILIKGDPGTGKSLILHHLAKEKEFKKSKIVFLGSKLYDFHENWNKENLPEIYQGKDILGYPKKILNEWNPRYDLINNIEFIFIDEFQRIEKKQFENLKKMMKKNKNIKIILFLSENQLLGNNSNEDIDEIIENIKSSLSFKDCKLKNSIRTNKLFLHFWNLLKITEEKLAKLINVKSFIKDQNNIKFDFEELIYFYENLNFYLYNPGFLDKYKQKADSTLITYLQETNLLNEDKVNIDLTRLNLGKEYESVNIIFDSNIFLSNELNKIFKNYKDDEIDNNRILFVNKENNYSDFKKIQKENIKNWREMYINITRTSKRLNIYVENKFVLEFLLKYKNIFFLKLFNYKTEKIFQK